MATRLPDDRTPAPLGDEGQETNRSRQPNVISRWLDMLARFGLGEALLRFASGAIAVVLVVVVVFAMRSFYGDLAQANANAAAGSLEPTPLPAAVIAALQAPDAVYAGIPRYANIKTTIPNRPRLEIVSYTVQPGDTVIGIAEKYGLRPQTILWGNYNTLRDDPHNLDPGQELVILPVDGTYYQWQPGDGLGGVATFFGVKPEDIINHTANQLSAETIGDYANPNIEPGTWLIVPGGSRPFYTWSAPVGVTRTNPAVASVLGAGSCGKVMDGAVGYGNFVWPANRHYLSGFDYSPETNHYGLDIAGRLGEPLYAVDGGVVVYAGWNDWGYGNMIIIDHGTGWQSLYAHASAINVACGQSVGQGEIIGAIGSTGRSSGPHLHFELMSSRYAKVNPWDFLPPP